MKEASIQLKNNEGMHARPAGLFTKKASIFKSDIKVYKNDDRSTAYNPKSILSLLSMGAAKGDTLTIVAEGSDEDDAVKVLTHLLENQL